MESTFRIDRSGSYAATVTALARKAAASFMTISDDVTMTEVERLWVGRGIEPVSLFPSRS